MKEKRYYEKSLKIAREIIDSAGLGEKKDLEKEAFKIILRDLIKDKGENIQKPHKQNKKRIYSLDEDPQEDIVSIINAEDFPYIHNLTSKLHIVFYVLKIMRDKYGKEGLIPSEIAKILVEKFRIKADQFNLSRKLGLSREFLERNKIKTKGGFAYKYRLMKKGEDYLEEELDNIHETQEGSKDEP